MDAAGEGEFDGKDLGMIFSVLLAVIRAFDQVTAPPRRVPSMEQVLRELERQPYTNPVGRTIFQKLCYVVTEMGVATGFHFNKGSYGPFADEVKAALHEFANRNWLREQHLGRMMALRVAPQYEQDRLKFRGEIERHERKIAKTVDLFSRIKNTEQAEEVLTVGARIPAMNRRTFLGSTAALTAGLAMARGDEKKVGANERVNVALVGCGGMGRANLRDFIRLPDFEVAALCDVDPKHIQDALDDLKKGNRPTEKVQAEKDKARAAVEQKARDALKGLLLK